MTRRVLACLWRGDDLPGYSSNKYDLGYAAKLRDMLGEQARLTLVTDFDCEEVPGIDTHRMKGIGVGGWTPVFEAFDAELWPKGNERCVLVGLDTIITGDIDYADVQLPRNYKYHAMAGGEFDEKGGCVFTSRRQMERTTDIANHHGERIMWNKPFSRYGSFD